MPLQLNGTNAVINESFITTSTLLASSWTGSSAPYTYSLTINGITDTSFNEITPTIDITLTQLSALQNANITDGGQTTNTVTLKAYGTKPTVDIPIRIYVRRYY